VGFGRHFFGRETSHGILATLAHGGRTLATYEIVITDTVGNRVCTSRLTCLIRDQVPGRQANGIDPLLEQGVTGGLTQRRGHGPAFAPWGGRSLTW
jgi:hypothetical protein